MNPKFIITKDILINISNVHAITKVDEDDKFCLIYHFSEKEYITRYIDTKEHRDEQFENLSKYLAG